MAIEAASWVADDESRETKSLLGAQAEFIIGNEKAIPRYNNM